MNISAKPASGLAIPFDHHRLDRLMDAAGIDVVVATSKHNVQYLLGGHRANFFDYMDATGITRYLPVLVYPKGHPEKAAYIGHRLEKFQHEVNPLWTPETQTNSAGSVDAMQKAVDYMKKAGLATKRIAAEFGFLPYDAANTLRAAFPNADWVDALYVLERQRVKKSADELKLLKYASEAVIDSMKAVIAASKTGTTKAEVIELIELAGSIQMLRSDRRLSLRTADSPARLQDPKCEPRRSTRALSNQWEEFLMNIPAQAACPLQEDRRQFCFAVVRETQQQSHAISKRLEQAMFIGARQ